VKTVFQVVAWPCELIFYLLAGPKCDLSEAEKAMLQRSPHFLPSVRSKMRLGRGHESNDSRGLQSLSTHFLPSRRPKMRLGWRRESSVFRGHLALRTHFIPSGLPKMRLWRGRVRDVLMCCLALRTHFLPSGKGIPVSNVVSWCAQF
jgi:hypothetical protein